MSLEKIKDDFKRNKWEKLLYKTHKELNSIGFGHIEFKSGKDDGSYTKARTGVTYSSWAFAKDKTRTWVELELKSKNNEKQTDLYRFIKSEYKKEPNEKLKITWDEEDLNNPSSKRRTSGKDIRIKVYLEENTPYLEDEKRQSIWVSTMVDFVKSFDPIIKKYGQ
jgi:hypothetical protein